MILSLFNENTENTESIDADFAASPTSGQAPLEVQFTDQSISQGEITSWQWDFESDGFIDSDAPHPTHIYSDCGVYSVTLIVSSGSVSDTCTKPELITLTCSDEKTNLSQDDPLRKQAEKVWEFIEQYEAMQILFLHRITGETDFAMAGGTMVEGTGVLRHFTMDGYLEKYCKQLGIREKIDVRLPVNVSGAHGAAIKAAQLVDTFLATQAVTIAAQEAVASIAGSK